MHSNMRLLFLIVFYFIIKKSEQHARMINPPARGSMWRFGFPVPANFDDMSLDCGGLSRQWDVNRGRCGVCGDASDLEVKPHEFGGRFATGIVGQSYDQGEVITIEIDLTGSHKGYFGFKLCKNDNPNRAITQECFDENPLRIIGNINEELAPQDLINDPENIFRYFVAPSVVRVKHNVQVQLPPSIICKACIIQWRYHSGNNFGLSKRKDLLCVGCGDVQEEFVNCADIEILTPDERKFKPKKPLIRVVLDEANQDFRHHSFDEPKETTTAINENLIISTTPLLLLENINNNNTNLHNELEMHMNMNMDPESEEYKRLHSSKLLEAITPLNQNNYLTKKSQTIHF